MGGGITGIGAGILTPFRKIKSLSAVLPVIQKKLILTAIFLLLLFTINVTLQILFPNLVLDGS
jgi:hypothetical protein